MPYANSLTHSHNPHLEMLSHLKMAFGPIMCHTSLCIIMIKIEVHHLYVVPTDSYSTFACAHVICIFIQLIWPVATHLLYISLL